MKYSNRMVVTQSMKLAKIFFATRSIIVVTALLVSGGCSGSIEPKSQQQSDIQPDVTFQQDGQSYGIANGDVFEKSGRGWKFVDKLYDPKYRDAITREGNGPWMLYDEESGRHYEAKTEFHTGFEDANVLEDLMTEGLWHQYTTNPENEGRVGNYFHIGNRISLESSVVRSGKKALKFRAEPDRKDVSKSSIRRSLLHFQKGDHIYFSGWYFIEPTPDMYDAGAFTIMDMESTYVGYLGFRLIFQSDDSLGFETKLPKRRYKQDRGSAVPFPQGKWVNVKLHAYLDDNDGMAKLYQDDSLVLTVNGPTLTVPDMIIDSLEVGATVIAKGSKHRKIVYVDDVSVSTKPFVISGR